MIIFGGYGFIGSYLEGTKPRCDVKQRLPVWDGPEEAAVVNLACVQPARGTFSLKEYYDTNVQGLINILDWAKDSGIDKVLTITSQKTTLKGELGKLVLTDHAATEVMARYHQEYGMQTIVLRIPPAFGPGPFVKGHGLGVFLAAAAKGDPIEVWGDPDARRRIVSVHDVASAINHLVAGDFQGVFDIPGLWLSLRTEVKVVNEAFGNRSQVLYMPSIPNDVGERGLFHQWSEITGWQATWSFKDIVEEFKHGHLQEL